MTPLKRILRDWRDSGALHTLVGVQSAIDHYTFLTKGGALMTVLEAKGRDPECLDEAELDRLARRLESALRTFDENYRLYQYIVKRQMPHLPQERREGALGELLDARRSFLEQKRPLYEVTSYFVVLYEPPHAFARAKQLTGRLRDFFSGEFSFRTRSRLLRHDLAQNSETLAQKVTTFAAQVEEVVRLRALSVSEAFPFLFGLLNYAQDKRTAARLRDGRYVDFQLCQSQVECYPDHLRLDDEILRVLTLKDLPAQTCAYQLRNLHALPCEAIVVSEWKRKSGASMRRRIQSRRRHFHNSKTSIVSYLNSSDNAPSDRLVDDSAVALVRDLGAALEACEANGQVFGQFSLSVVLHGKDPKQVQKATADVLKQTSAFDAQMIDERYNVLNAWLATLPGNTAFNLRRAWLLDTNCADWTLFGTPDQGSLENGHLGSEYLAAFETQDGAPYFFNFHEGDVAHTAVFGETGSGKSFLLNFLITQALKYEPYVYVLDLGGSYKKVARHFAGTYVRLGAGQAFTINPFALEPTPANLQFLHSLVKVLIEGRDFRLQTADEADLYDQIKNLYVIEPSQRRLLTLSNILGRETRQRLKPWVQGGQYGWLFDNAEDHLSMARFQVFDFEGMDTYPDILQPLLFYVLHRASDVVTDESTATTFKAFFIDEAWRFFRHPAVKLYITEALKTWRRRNAAMILATQSTEDLVATEVLPVVSESCPTKLFLSNRGMDARIAREVFHLNETEAAALARLTPKRELLIKRPSGSKIVSLSVDPSAYELYSTGRPEFENRPPDASVEHPAQTHTLAGSHI